jgi:predicted dienelactone hydrolase
VVQSAAVIGFSRVASLDETTNAVATPAAACGERAGHGSGLQPDRAPGRSVARFAAGIIGASLVLRVVGMHPSPLRCLSRSACRFVLAVVATSAPAGCAAAASVAAAAPVYAATGPRSVSTALVEVVDTGRDRRVPLKLYLPSGADALPVVLFSHGLGGSREGGRGWGEHWASHGFLSIHLQHPGSDESIARGGDGARDGRGQAEGKAPGEGTGRMRDAVREAMTPRAFADRVADVRFVLDLLEREPARIHAGAVRRDPKRIGLSGHSYGARTTLAVAGERVPFSAGEFVDARVRAGIAFSPMAPPPPESWPRRFGLIAIPLLSVTGTLDRDIIGGATPDARREPFRHMPPGDKYLLVLEGADHMVFNAHDGGRLPAAANQPAILAHVRAVTLAFWKAYLAGDADARRWLAGDGVRAALGGAGVFQAK